MVLTPYLGVFSSILRKTNFSQKKLKVSLKLSIKKDEAQEWAYLLVFLDLSIESKGGVIKGRPNLQSGTFEMD